MGSSIGGIAGGLFGASNTPSSPTLSTYQPTGTAAFDQTYQNLLNSSISNNPYTQYAPQATATFNQQYNNPYAAGYQTAANNAGSIYANTGNQAVANGNALSAAGNTGLAGANQVLNMSMDPQGALYAQQLQKLNDQTNATSAANGTTNSPYAASVSNNANTNFNIDWQNNQLQRAIQGLSSYNSGAAGAVNDFSGAQSLGTAGAQDISNSGAIPYDTANAITGQQSAALNQLLSILGTGAQGYNQTNLADLMSYLQLGTGQANQQANLNQTSYLDALQAAQSGASGIGGIASGLTNGLNSLTGGTNATAFNPGSYFSNIFGSSGASPLGSSYAGSMALDSSADASLPWSTAFMAAA